jgi:hypothetical protein
VSIVEVKNIPTEELKPYDKNAKKHDKKQINNVAESIRQFGFVQPIVIDRDGVIVIGHCRALAAKKLGMEEVPCVCVDELTAEQVKKLRLIDNRTNESPWDMDLLARELNKIDLSGFDLGFGIYDGEDDTYTQKVDIPQYKITGECPSISDMLDTEKSKELIENIKKSNIKDDEKYFLIEAAKRHNKFNYRCVAEYYAHANAEMQKLMEDSGLVIIDINDAIKNGFAKLSKSLQEIINDR